MVLVWLSPGSKVGYRAMDTVHLFSRSHHSYEIPMVKIFPIGNFLDESTDVEDFRPLQYLAKKS